MNLLITGAWNTPPNISLLLREMGYTLFFMQDELGDLPCEPGMIHGIVCNGLFLHHSVDLFPNLKFVQLTSAGYDRVPMEILSERGIRVFNARGVYDIPMAEFALCGVLQLYKNSAFFLRNRQEHTWLKYRDIPELEGKTVCIVGCGSVGTTCARKFHGMDCRVLGVDVYPVEHPAIERVYPFSQLTEALSQGDIVILTVPLLPETKHLMDSKAFAVMKQGAVLVNISRGAVVDTSALISALEGKLLGAVLDVFESEPLPKESPLWDMEQVILTPHNSFVGEGNATRLSSLILKNVQQYSLYFSRFRRRSSCLIP